MCSLIAGVFVLNQSFNVSSFFTFVYCSFYCITSFSFRKYKIKKTEKTLKLYIKEKEKG